MKCGDGTTTRHPCWLNYSDQNNLKFSHPYSFMGPFNKGLFKYWILITFTVLFLRARSWNHRLASSAQVMGRCVPYMYIVLIVPPTLGFVPNFYCKFQNMFPWYLSRVEVQFMSWRRVDSEGNENSGNSLKILLKNRNLGRLLWVSERTQFEHCFDPFSTVHVSKVEIRERNNNFVDD